MNITECEGYKKLLKCVEDNEKESPNFHDYREKLQWVIDRVNHYAEKTKLNPCDILNKWEELRTYWYMNYYQDCNQPLLDSDNVKVFETQEQLFESIGKSGFRCPACNGITTSPYVCKAGTIVKGKVCDWKVYGLFGHMGKGVFIFVKGKMKGENIFNPIAWENEVKK